MRLIDADKLDWWYKGRPIRRVIDEAPTVDAVEVVHGRWEKSEDGYFELHIIKCSVCHEEWCFEEAGDVVAMHYKHCPNCGAKMDGERRTDK